MAEFYQEKRPELTIKRISNLKALVKFYLICEFIIVAHAFLHPANIEMAFERQLKEDVNERA